MSEHEQSTNQDKQSIAHFAAIKTAIANGDENEVKARTAGKSIDPLERDYLVELAQLNGNSEMIKVLEAMPSSK